MVANITTGNDVYGALAYNQQKVDKGAGAVLATHLIREPTDGRFSVAETAEDFLRWMPSHYRTEKPVVHIPLNPDPAEPSSWKKNMVCDRPKARHARKRGGLHPLITPKAT